MKILSIMVAVVTVAILTTSCTIKFSVSGPDLKSEHHTETKMTKS